MPAGPEALVYKLGGRCSGVYSLFVAALVTLILISRVFVTHFHWLHLMIRHSDVAENNRYFVFLIFLLTIFCAIWTTFHGAATRFSEITHSYALCIFFIISLALSGSQLVKSPPQHGRSMPKQGLSET